MRALCLDEIDGWYDAFDSFLELGSVVEIMGSIEAKGKVDLEEFLYSLNNDIHSEKSSANQLIEEWKDYFDSVFTNAVAYHGTRILDERSYLENGIKKSNPRALIEMACDMFGCDNEINEAVKDIGYDYLAHNEGKVGFLFSERCAIEMRSSHPDGSELIRGIMNRIGRDSHEKWFNQGRACLIRCDLPLKWLEGSVRESYVKMSLQEGLFTRVLERTEFAHLRGGFMFEGDVPPEYIHSILDFTPKSRF